MWSYLQSQTDADPCGEMWTTGFFDDDGDWIAESDWATAGQAADRATLLNAGREDDAVMRPRPGHPVPEALMASMS